MNRAHLQRFSKVSELENGLISSTVAKREEEHFVEHYVCLAVKTRVFFNDFKEIAQTWMYCY